MTVRCTAMRHVHCTVNTQFRLNESQYSGHSYFFFCSICVFYFATRAHTHSQTIVTNLWIRSRNRISTLLSFKLTHLYGFDDFWVLFWRFMFLVLAQPWDTTIVPSIVNKMHASSCSRAHWPRAHHINNGPSKLDSECQIRRHDVEHSSALNQSANTFALKQNTKTKAAEKKNERENLNKNRTAGCRLFQILCEERSNERMRRNSITTSHIHNWTITATHAENAVNTQCQHQTK